MLSKKLKNFGTLCILVGATIASAGAAIKGIDANSGLIPGTFISAYGFVLLIVGTIIGLGGRK